MATVVTETDNLGLRWALWSLCVAAWTVVLVTTQPVHVMHDVLPAQAAFPVAKTGHVVGYAFLTVLSAWLGVRRERRWLLLVFLSLHGMGTEFVQTFVPDRSGSWRDVGIDHIGILLGAALELEMVAKISHCEAATGNTRASHRPRLRPAAAPHRPAAGAAARRFAPARREPRRWLPQRSSLPRPARIAATQRSARRQRYARAAGKARRPARTYRRPVGRIVSA